MNLPHYPATLRNRDPILSAIKKHLPKSGKILETASGTGEHITYFAQNTPSLEWQPSDRSDDMFWAIQARSINLKNVDHPMRIDVTEKNLDLCEKYNAMFNINMIHISPWESCLGLFALASRILLPNGFIYIYGPYKKNGLHTAPSNASFDAGLREQNSLWGVRDMEDVIDIAEQNGFVLREIVAMPANNFSLFFYRRETIS